METDATKYPSPKRLLVIASTIIFFTELVVMYWIENYANWDIHHEILLDPVLTVILTLPVLYFSLFRPLNQQFHKRIKAEKALQAQETYLDQLIENAPEAIVTLDTTFRVVRINEEFTRLFGYEASEAVGREIANLVLPSGLESMSTEINGSIIEGHQVSLEAIRRCKDGSSVQVSILGTPILIEGKVVGIYGIYRDISERKSAESALRASEEKYRQLVESADDIIYRTDDKGRFTYVNAVALSVTGMRETELLGSSYLDLVLPTYQTAVAEFYKEQFHALNPNTYFEFPIATKDGGEVWIGQNVQLFMQDGRVSHVQALARDITVRILIEEKLRESEQRFQSILNTIKDVIWSVSPQDNRLLYLSPSVEDLLGLPMSELPDKPFDVCDFVHPDDLEMAQSGKATVFDAGFSNREFRILRPDGGIRWVTTFMQLMRDDEGIPIRVDGILHDITKRKNAESKLTVHEKYYHALIDNSLDIVVVLNLDATISYNSPSMDKALGLEPNALVGKSAFTLVHPDDHAPTRTALTAAIAQPGTMHAVEIRVRHRDGSWRIFQAKGMCVSDEESYVVVNATDITERKSAEVKIHQLSRAVEQSPVSVVITDTEGRIEYVNPWFCELTGYPYDDMIGKNPSVVHSGFTPESVYNDLWDTITSGGTWRGEFCNRKKNGDTYWESATISPIRDSDGTLCNFIAVKEDITKRKAEEKALVAAREAAEEAMSAKSEFLATMSHEIRTPMNGVVGMTDLLLETELTPEQRDYAETIRVSNDALLAVINDILDFSKIESGNIELENRPFDLTATMEMTLEVFSLKAAEKGIELLCHVDPSLPAMVVGDETRLRQVLLNLVGNALKFTESGEVSISVWPVDMNSATCSSDELELLFEVADTGIGVPKDKMDRLFKPFSQVDSSTTRKYGGTGLGLAISEKLVLLMGGNLGVESCEGEGSSFSFNVRLSSDRAATQESVPSELSCKKVLIVDDNATNRKILATQCGRLGMLVHSTGDPGEALDWVRNGVPFDLGIIDMQMPDMDGAALGQAIRRMKTRDELPLILLSSINRHGMAREAGVFSAFITKPAKWAHLRENIRNLCASPFVSGTGKPEEINKDLGPQWPLRILLAEDNPINQKLAVKMFEKMGYRVDVVEDGLQAVQAVQEKTYDIIFMDMQMPHMDGVEATRHIQAMAGAERRPRIVAMTANASEKDKQECLQAGMDDFVTKPINIKIIQSKLKQWGGIKMQVTSSQTAGRPVVNIEHLQDLGLFDDSLGELAGLFFEHVPSLIGGIKKHANMGELSGFQERVHELKGCCANMGAFAMVAVCEELQRVNGHQRPKEINVIIHRLGLAYEETRHRLEQLVRTCRVMSPVEAA